MRKLPEEERKRREKESRKKARKKLEKNKYERLNNRILKGKKEIYKKASEVLGFASYTEMIETTMDKLSIEAGFEKEIREANGGSLQRQYKNFELFSRE